MRVSACRMSQAKRTFSLVRISVLKIELVLLTKDSALSAEIHYPALPKPVHFPDYKPYQSSPLRDAAPPQLARTPPNIGRRRLHVASLTHTPPRHSYSQQIVGAFTQATPSRAVAFTMPKQSDYDSAFPRLPPATVVRGQRTSQPHHPDNMPNAWMTNTNQADSMNEGKSSANQSSSENRRQDLERAFGATFVSGSRSVTCRAPLMDRPDSPTLGGSEGHDSTSTASWTDDDIFINKPKHNSHGLGKARRLSDHAESAAGASSSASREDVTKTPISRSRRTPRPTRFRRAMRTGQEDLSRKC